MLDESERKDLGEEKNSPFPNCARVPLNKSCKSRRRAKNTANV